MYCIPSYHHLSSKVKPRKSLFSSLLGLLLRLGLLSILLEDLLDNLLLLDKESTDNLLLDAVGAERATVSTVDSLLGVVDTGVLAGSQGSKTGESNGALTALGSGGVLLEVKVSEVATGGLNNLDLVRSSVVYKSR